MGSQSGVAAMRAGNIAFWVVVVLVDIHFLAAFAAKFDEFAVHGDGRGTGALMQVIHVLGDELERKVRRGLGLGESLVSGIGLRLLELSASKLVKAPYRRGIASPCLRGGDRLDAVPFPQAVVVAKGAKAGFSGAARSGQNDNVGGGSSGAHARFFRSAAP